MAKKKNHLTSSQMTTSRNGLFKIAWSTFLMNSPRGLDDYHKETRAKIIECVNWYAYKLPVSTQEFSRFVARETYNFWKEHGYKKVKVLNKRTGKKNSIWHKVERKFVGFEL